MLLGIRMFYIREGDVSVQSYIYILRSAEQTAGQEKRRQYTYDERIYIKGILYELFYLITKQI